MYYMLQGCLSFCLHLPSTSTSISFLLRHHIIACSIGTVQSCKQAFAWQRCLVRCLVTLADRPALLGQHCRILADMLTTTSSSRFAPHLHVNTRLVLAVGGYQTCMRSTHDGPAILAWLQGCLEVPALPCPTICTAFTCSAQSDL